MSLVQLSWYVADIKSIDQCFSENFGFLEAHTDYLKMIDDRRIKDISNWNDGRYGQTHNDSERTWIDPCSACNGL